MRKNEITVVHLVRTYCIPILIYGSEIWHITDSEKRSLNVLWNNTFRKIFNCCWRESPFSLQFYTGCLSNSRASHHRATNGFIL